MAEGIDQFLRKNKHLADLFIPPQAYSNDVNRAVNAFFEDPDALRKQVGAPH